VPPYFKKEPKNTRVPLGGSAYFNCQADGKPVPNISWTDEKLHLLNNSRYTQFPNGTLWIKDVQHEDATTYICVITFDLSKEVTLTVSEPEDSSSDNEISEYFC